jgi:hypothetical protein
MTFGNEMQAFICLQERKKKINNTNKLVRCRASPYPATILHDLLEVVEDLARLPGRR